MEHQTFIEEIRNEAHVLEGDAYLCFSGSSLLSFHKSKEDLPEDFARLKAYSTPELLDEKTFKFFVPFSKPFGHFFTDTLTEIVIRREKVTKSGKTFELIVPPLEEDLHLRASDSSTASEYFLDVFQRSGDVIHRVPKSADDTGNVLVHLRNVVVIPVVSFNAWSVKKLRDFILSLPDTQVEGQDRKVYLDRRGTPDTQLVFFEELNFIRTTDNRAHTPPAYTRISNEATLVEFLGADKKYEPVMPETFTNFGDQVRFFSSVSTLASTTSSGLFNMFFMPKGSTVIEFVTPLTVKVKDIPPQYETSYHNQYSLWAFVCDLNYVGIPHNRDADVLIEKLKNFPL